MIHTVTIRKNDIGMFDVLINGISYRIHRCMSADDALKTALDIKKEFNALNERSKIIRGWLR